MIASLAALALLSALLRQFLKVTASTLSTLTHVLAAVLVQVYVPLAHPLRTNFYIKDSHELVAYGCFLYCL